MSHKAVCFLVLIQMQKCAHLKLSCRKHMVTAHRLRNRPPVRLASVLLLKILPKGIYSEAKKITSISAPSLITQGCVEH